MDRRKFMKACGIASTGAALGLAGCSGNSAPPPRRSNVIKPLKLTDDNTLVVSPVDESDMWLQTRRDVAAASVSYSLIAVSPIGIARAAKGRGAVGRGAGGFQSAPKTRKGRGWFYGGAYVNGWHDDHGDEVDRVSVDIETFGFARLGSDAAFEEQAPGPGPVDWDETFKPPTDGTLEIAVTDRRVGWYRLGANTVSSDGTDLGWESIDFRLESDSGAKEIDERWKVSPRL